MSDKETGDVEAKLAELHTQLDAYRKQLIEAHQMTAVGQLLAGVVHEINTPIGSILSNNEVSSRSIELLKTMLEQAKSNNSAPSPKALKILGTLEKLSSVDKIACERIAAVVRSLKTFVGGKASDFRRADLNEILSNTLKLCHCEFRHRIEVSTDYDDLQGVECDAHQIGQVFLNILVNAGQAIGGEGRVSIATTLEGDFAHVSISDSGGGIPPEHRESIFSSGFTTKPAGVGTGLGLAISRDIVEAHGGKISFETETGHGTTFHVRIPVSRPATGTG